LAKFYPQIKIEARIANAMIVKIVPTAAVELSKKLSDIVFFFSKVKKFLFPKLT
jgi:hypothetical protein